ncbi:hypothetical protein RJ639_001127 [Escallonia herrerae]|uniref:Transcription factor IIIC 90kDa subunit N-terminal domain-containing protein n=1 Tax=Escallonia herrerae TaxID=1293975 RepID=A0AA89BGE9_9ASTE|nr:hypothetical protein RJ639_001127 [Escallonia herrerae]
MASRFQAASLVASPAYPNAVAWSDENLVAVASGHLVTILVNFQLQESIKKSPHCYSIMTELMNLFFIVQNPATPFGPRGLITIPPSKPFPIGVVERKDLLSGSLFPICLSRDVRPCVRSISWSPIGLAPNGGCLLAVCTSDGRVKIYRFPFREFSPEWVEVVDISESLYTYLANNSSWEIDVPSSELSDGQEVQPGTESACNEDLPVSVLRKEPKRRRNALAIINVDSEKSIEQSLCSGNSEDTSPSSSLHTEKLASASTVLTHAKDNQLQIVPASNSKAKASRKVSGKCSSPVITADEYASRSAMLSSTFVAWSPILEVTSASEPLPSNNSMNCCSILAVGGKTGKISFWRINGPECYSIMHSGEPCAGLLIGFLQAHNSWITAISWTLLVSDPSNPQLLLATGSSDGSVKIWQDYSLELLKSSEVSHALFYILKEVSTVDSIPVSVISLAVPKHSPHKVLLAVGKGSGSLEVLLCDISTRELDKAGSYDAHDHIVTGLAWAFDGSCLYSCSQDNTLHSWIICGNSLCKVPTPSNTPGVKNSTDVPYAFDSCFGLAVSPGNIVVAVARSFDADLLNPMYQARAQKAAVEFFWIGGQALDNLSNRSPDFDVEAFPDEELVYWDYNILWSLNFYEHLDRPVVMWDIVAALLAFKQSSPEYVEHILVRWVTSFVGSELGLSPAKILPNASRFLSNLSSRQLHLLNIVSRCVVLGQVKAERLDCKNQSLERLWDFEEELTLWVELLDRSEKELQQRLVGFSFSAGINLVSHSSSFVCKPRYWQPVGLAQMEQWVAINHDQVKDDLKLLGAELRKLNERYFLGPRQFLNCSRRFVTTLWGTAPTVRNPPIHVRLHTISAYIVEEQCTYCSASVPFESAEAAVCQGVECDGVVQNHKLTRCAVSMQVCPTVPSWYCVCCNRWASKLAPHTLFSMARYPADFKLYFKTSTVEIFSKPLCPFCGVLLQRSQPEFLLSASPV